MRNDSIIKTAVYQTQPPEWTKFTHIVLVYLQRVIGKRKYIQRRHPRHSTHNQEDIRNIQRHTAKLKPKQNCTSHSNFTYAHIVKIAFVIFIVPYRYLNTC